MRLQRAVTRAPAPNFGDGLTTASLGIAQWPLARTQHAAYEDALRALGIDVVSLPPLADFPDSWFVEDVAVITPARAIVTRPGAATRRGEAPLIEPTLARYRELARIEPPGTLDGGDVLLLERRAFIGVSSRSNRAGAEQLRELLAAEGIAATLLEVGAGLHLKSSVSHAGGERLLLAPALASHAAFAGYEQLVLEPADAYAANSLYLNDCLLLPAGFERVRARLARAGVRCVELAMSEARKMDGGLTCLSLRL